MLTMGTVLGAVIPLAAGIVISPVPVIAVILLLLSPKARRTSVGFLVGWVGGVTTTVSVFTIVAAAVGVDQAGWSVGVAIIETALGVVLLLAAVLRWRSHSRVAAELVLPQWMAAIDTMNVAQGLLLGFSFSALNPKNLLLGIAAGVAIGSAQRSTAQSALAIVLFVLIASALVATLVITYLAASARMAAPLTALRGWLVRHNAAVTAILLLVFGLVFIVTGISSF